MFWKKKNKSQTEGNGDLILPEDQRRAVRVRPHKDAPVVFTVKDRPYQVRDISATGAAFQAPPEARAGQPLEVSFHLPYVDADISCGFSVIDVQAGVARGMFLSLSEADVENLHRYAHENQVIRLRQEAEARKGKLPA